MEKIKELNKNKLVPSEFEEKWRSKWLKCRIYQPDIKSANGSTSLRPSSVQTRKPFYNLMMFPYPSAEGLHVGNMYAFTGADIYGRFKRMQGNDVFEPIGLDGFGIHSENYAIKIGKHPTEQAKVSQKNFYRQLQSIGNGFAWENRLETYDPAYYKWTQWIFVQMFKHGLAYRKKAPVNYCPSCKTVLSDEQVIEGRCERCKSLVEIRDLEQWFFKITNYAERLLKNLDKIDWVEKVKTAQRHWIGKSDGVLFEYKVKDLPIKFAMFDSVPQTFMAQTFTVIAPEHPQLPDLVRGTEHEKPVMEFIEMIRRKRAAKKLDPEKEIEGVFTGRYLEYTPAKRLLPIWVASFVIAEYGTGVVNASAHDERDFAFAKKYKLLLHPVMFPKDPKEAEKVKKLEYCYHHEPEGILEEPVQFKGRKWGEIREEIIKFIEKNGWGKKSAQYHLRDWLISRQRYWGPPIPMIYCDKCFCQPVPEKDLPVLLPFVENYRPTGTGQSPLAQDKEWVKVKCPKCGSWARRETDVSDTFLDSAWYFLRYPSVNQSESVSQSKSVVSNQLSVRNTEKLKTGNRPSKAGTDKLPWDPEITRKWLPVNMYIGGAEHSVLHLLYSRFVTMAFNHWGILDFEEPFTRFYAHGLIIAEGAKMSKSKGNIIVPDQYIKAYGADAFRSYLMFLGPFDAGGDFRDAGIAGMYRFLGRVWRLVNEHFDKLSAKEDLNPLDNLMHKTVKEVIEDLENLRYNTAISHIMEYVNGLSEDKKNIKMDHFRVLLKLLAPFAPFMTEELWQLVDSQSKSVPVKGGVSQSQLSAQFNSIHLQSWPSYDPKFLVEEMIDFVIQVNGKVREIIKIQNPKSKIQTEMEKIAKESEKVKKYIEGKTIKKVIFVPGKLINFVI